jgi:beta-lactam-binding protein with PASTA domain
MATARRHDRMPLPARPPTLRLLWVTVSWATVLAVLAVVVWLANPAAAAGRREPPDVVGLTLPEARTLIQQQWYPGVRSFAPTIRVLPDPLPAQVPPEAARVVTQTVVQYLEDSSELSRAAVIDLVAGTAVPDLVGRSRDEAQALLEAVGLSLETTGTGPVGRHDPVAGTLVPYGTTVKVVLVPATSSTGTTPARTPPSEPDAAATVPDDTGAASWVGWPVGAVLLAVALVGLWALRSARRPPGHPPAPARVRVDPHPDPAPVVSVHPQAADAELVVRIVPGPDLGRLDLTEVSR